MQITYLELLKNIKLKWNYKKLYKIMTSMKINGTNENKWNEWKLMEWMKINGMNEN